MLENIRIKFPLVESAGYSIFADKIINEPMDKDGCSGQVSISIAVVKKDAGDCLRELERINKELSKVNLW